MKEEIATAQSSMANLEKENELLHSTINDLELYSRRECVEIKGIAYDVNESTDDIVLKIAKDMGLVLKKSDISTSHRIHHYNKGKRSIDGSSDQNISDKEKNLNIPPKIMVKFISRQFCDSFMENRHKIKVKEIFINENLTKTKRELFNKCLLFKKENQFKYIWTENGKTHLRRNDESPIIAISNADDLKRHRII